MPGDTHKRYPPELKEQAVRMVAEIRTSDDNTQPKIQRQHSDWHNGYYIAILKR